MSRAISVCARTLLVAALVPASAHADPSADPLSPWTGAPPPAPAEPASDPFAFADFTWLTGNPRTTESPLGNDIVTGEVRVDTQYLYSFNHPEDDTISGSSESFRSNEIQLTQLGIGGDFHYKGVRARLMTQFGMLLDGNAAQRREPARGQWNLADAYRVRLRGLRRLSPRRACTASTSTPASSCRTSGCAATTTSTTGPISRRTSRRTRRGSSTACACRSSRPTS